MDGEVTASKGIGADTCMSVSIDKKNENEAVASPELHQCTRKKCKLR